jgi:TolB protein
LRKTLLVLAALVALAPAVRADEPVRVDIYQGSKRDYRIALQKFSAPGALYALREDFHQGLGSAIDFSGVLRTIDPKAFLDSVETRQLSAGIQCNNWKGIGADGLVQGEVRVSGDMLLARYKVWDTVKCVQLGELTEARRIRREGELLARVIADDIVERFTGRRGVAATQIAFVSNQPGSKQIFLMEANGANKRPVTRNRSINLFPGWSADGRSLVYTSYKTGRPEIWTIYRGTRPGDRLLRSGDEQLRAVWSRRNGLGALVLNRNGNTDIYALRGQRLERLTNHGSIEVSPTFSPDGRRMAFVSDRGGSPQIYVKDLETGEEKRLTYRGQYNSNPAWSPTGEWIAYTARTSGGFDIYLIDPDNGFTTPLVMHPRTDEDPAWSPDGRKIAFTSNRRGRKDIYLIDWDGENLMQVTQNFGNCSQPAWSGWLD